MTQLQKGFYKVSQGANLRWKITSRKDYPVIATLEKDTVVYATEINMGESYFDGNSSGGEEGAFKFGGWRNDHSWVIVVSDIDDEGGAPQGWIDNAKMTRLRNDVENSFVQGDVLYGRSEAREPWVQRLGDHDFGVGLTRYRFNIIDSLNIAILNNRINDREVQNFADFLGDHCGKQASDVRIRKMCKSGLTYVTQVRKHNVHFVLDGLDARRVVDESGVASRLGTQENWSFPTKYCTGAEMRRLMRQRMSDMRLPGGRDYQIDLDKVLFYLATERVDAPWERNAPSQWKNAWERYKGLRQDNI